MRRTRRSARKQVCSYHSPFEEVVLEIAHLVPFFISFFLYLADFSMRLFRERSSRWLGASLFGAAFSFHTLFLALRWAVTGHAPFVGMFESISFYTWSTALAALVVSFWGILPGDGREALLVSGYCAFFSLAGTLSPKAMVPKIPVLDTVWFEAHVALSFLSYGVITISLPLSLRGDYESREPFVERLALYGFSLFSAGMVAGGIWAYYAWGSYWIWTPKEVFSAVLWLYYGALIHSRLDNFFTPAVRRGLHVLGFVIMMFTYLGVSLLLKSSHSFR